MVSGDLFDLSEHVALMEEIDVFFLFVFLII